MTTIEAKVPDYLAALAAEAAAKEKTTLDQIIALALSAQLSILRLPDEGSLLRNGGEGQALRYLVSNRRFQIADV